MSLAAVVLPALLLLVLALVSWWNRSRAVGPAGTVALALVGVPDTTETRVLLGRWRDRSRRWRATAVVPAFVVSCVASVRYTSELRFGLVDTAGVSPLYADPLVATLLALALGGLAAELHHLRRPSPGPRTADLTPRDVTDLRRSGSRARRVVLVALIAGSVALHVALVPDEGGAGSPAALVVATVLVVAGEVTERRIAVRPRPALTADLVAADDVVRRAAVRSVDDAASGAALLLIGWATLGLAGEAPGGVVVDTATVLGSLSVLGVAVWWAVRSAPRRLLPERPTARAGAAA